jgi:hypothetical protein
MGFACMERVSLVNIPKQTNLYTKKYQTGFTQWEFYVVRNFDLILIKKDQNQARNRSIAVCPL